MSTVHSLSGRRRVLAVIVTVAAVAATPAAFGAAPGPSHTASASATATRGVEAAAGLPKNCVQRLQACGYPHAGNTGVKDPSKLKASGSVYADKDGQVIQNLDIHGDINVAAANVVIRNVRVTADDGDWVIMIRPGTENLTIKDSEIMSPTGATVDNACILNISDARPRMIRLNIHGCTAGVSSGGGKLRDSYIHDPGFTPGLSHITLVASNADGHFTIKHNTILNPHSQTAAVAFYQDFGPQSDNLVENNLLAGGGYVFYGGNGGYSETHDIRFVNNRLSRIFYNKGGYWGTAASFDVHNPGNEWSGNFWDDTLKPAR
jgi:hypothetical protein